MITQKDILSNGRKLVHTYSDLYYIQQVETGRVYESAVDVPNKFTYVETEELLPIKEEIETEDASTEI